MTSKRILGALVILLALCLTSTAALTEVPGPERAKSKPAVVKPSDPAMKAKPMRAIELPGPFKECNPCFRDQWGNNVRVCCTTYWGDRHCYYESCPAEPDVLK